MSPPTPVALRLADPDGAYAAVRLAGELPLTDERRSFARADGEWVLELVPENVLRLEYELELESADGSKLRVCDPGNPRRAPGAFGEKSVLRAAGLRGARVAGARRRPGPYGRARGARPRARG